jgi:L-fuculose-phosphate aldolase
VGNLSVRRENHLLITPTRVPYWDMVTRDVVTVAVDSGRWTGRRSPSRELPLHLALYRARPEIGAVVHTHSPYATAWSFTGRSLPDTGPSPMARTEELQYYGLDDIPTTGTVEPAGSVQLGDAVACAMPTGGAVLLRGHGVVVAAPTLSDALSRAAAVEHQALVTWLVRGLGHGPDGGPAPQLHQPVRSSIARARDMAWEDRR